MVFPSPPPAFDGTITTWLEAEAEGEVAVPLERLAALVRHFPADAEIAIAADDRAATVTSGRSRFKLPVFPIADLPERHILGEETGRVELDAKIARDLFARPAFAAADEASRPYLRGIFLHNTGDNLVAVAADGFRFCRVTTPATTTLSTDRSLIIPNEMVKTINRLLGNASGNVTLRRSERLFSVEGAGFAVVSTSGSMRPIPIMRDGSHPRVRTSSPPAAPGLARRSHVLRRWPTRRPERMSSACAGTPTDCT